jgi:hypothetical protein
VHDAAADPRQHDAADPGVGDGLLVALLGLARAGDRVVDDVHLGARGGRRAQRLEDGRPLELVDRSVQLEARAVGARDEREHRLLRPA